MASTSKSWIGLNSWVSCYLVVSANANATGNYSDVTAKLYGARNDGGNSYNNSSSNFWININGTQTSRGGACQVSGSAWQLVHSQTTRVYHNDDGSKTITISAGGGITDTTFQMGSNSLSLTLDKIARKSSLSASNGTLGTAQTLTITKQNASYTDTITYKCGSATGTIATKTTSKTVSWTPPIDLAKQNTTGTTVSVTLTIETFNGSTSLGTNTKTITCTMPSSVKPTVSISLSDMMGYLSKYGAYVQGKSVLSGTLTASGSYGSSIKAYSTSVDGKTFNGSTFTVNPIANSGTLTVSVTVTDSRGRKGTASTTISVLPYASPKLTNVSAKRCDSNGASNSSGEYLQVSFKGTITALNNKNSATYKVQYKKTSESSYTTVTLTDYNGKYSASGSYIFSADKSSSYDIIVTASDDFSSTTKQIVGSSVSKVFSILAKGLGFAFGKVAEIENALEVAWDVYCQKRLYLKRDNGSYMDVLGEVDALIDLKPSRIPCTNLGAVSTFAEFWNKVDRLFAQTNSGVCAVRVSIQSGCLSNGLTGWRRIICASQNLAGNEQWPVGGSMLVLNDDSPVWYCRVTGGADGYNSLGQHWTSLIGSDNVANNFTTTSAGYVADARTVYRLANRFSQPAWATSHTFTLTSGYFYLFVGLDCTFSAYTYSSGAVNVHQISKASSSKVTYTTGTNTVTFKTSDGGTCAFLVITGKL